ncbi:MAG: 50S ribosomal protein L15 [Bacteroidota bacterium]|nr:50S ribosomal protein L15 [Bacteroidota bacterium]
MKIGEIRPAKGAVKTSKRIGRGVGSGKGGTATKGHKGDKSRAGHKTKLGFEGGQMPLQRRVPKFGFTNINRVEYKSINLDVIQKLVDDKKITTIDKEVLKSNGLVSKNDRVKLLARGEIKSKVNIKVDAFSVAAKEAIEKAGGIIESTTKA